MNERQVLGRHLGPPNVAFVGGSGRSARLPSCGCFRPTHAVLLQPLGCPLPPKPVVGIYLNIAAVGASITAARKTKSPH